MKLVNCTLLWYTCTRAQKGRYLFQWLRLVDENWPLFKRSSFMITVTHGSCSNFKCQVSDVNKQIPIDFIGVKCVSLEIDQPRR